MSVNKEIITFNKCDAHPEPEGLPQCLSQILNFDKGSKSSRNITQ